MRQHKGHKGMEMRDDEAVVPLQAILLADSFTQKFRPITMEYPKVLLPLANVPMIDYTLEWLASVGVEEVFVFCCAHSKQVTNYLEKSQWKSQSNFSVIAIESNDCVSAGDALRLIDQQNVIRGDFILVSGDTMSNMCLRQALQEHKERRKKDKLAVMTMVFKRTKPSAVTHQNRFGNDELLLVVDPKNKQLIYYEDKRDHNKSQRSLRNFILDSTVLSERPAVQLYTDLQDCFIDICSPEVLLLFTDNFDYQQLRRDFVKGLLSDEVMGYKIFTYEISSEYAARIDNFRSYDVVSKDILQRWTYPLVPDIQFSKNGSSILFERQYVYKATGTQESRSATVGRLSLIGNDTSIGDHSTVTDSIIGEGCIIGCNVTIEGCYIWNNVTVHDNSCLRYAIVCDRAIIKEGAVIEPGTILSFNVVIGKGFTVPRYSKISLMQKPAEVDSDEELEYAEAASGSTDSPDKLFSGSALNDDANYQNEEVDGGLSDEQSWNALEVGVGGAGYRWTVSEGNQDDEWRHSVAPFPSEKIAELTQNIQHEAEETEMDIVDTLTPSEATKPESDTGDDDFEKPDAYFNKEVEETFRRAALGVAGVEEDHVILEVNALRLAYNMSFSDCAGALFHSILSLALQAVHGSSRELLTHTRKALSEWKNLLRHYVKSEDDEVEILLKFEEICMETGKEFSPIFLQVLNILYDEEIVSEDAILSWASEKEGADDSDKIFLHQAEPFIKWLREASEEEEEE
eukprot:TRINITY_DN3563_c0_g2_i1.p1 TRINITY_DN3563_c0_g2~~TRINITY_DN3563_c0_g2_i1.p1  ORF type:complete len:742 (-),score=186.19 TRINITY_DN3563_c0_g2_i1:165-2390(-)